MRDKRTVIGLIIIPVLLMPVMMLGLPLLMQNRLDRVQEERPDVVVIGGDHAPDLYSFMDASGVLTIVQANDPEQALAKGEVQAILAIPQDFAARLAAEQGVQVEIKYDASAEKSGAAHSKLSNLLSEYSRMVVYNRLTSRGVDPAILQPIDVESVNTAPEEKMGNLLLSFLLPMVIGIWASLGGMYTAIDVAAGEKERGTLEPLLATPPQRVSLVMGKYLTVVATSLFSASLALASMILSVAVVPRALLMGAEEAVSFILPPQTIAMFFLSALLLSGLFSAVSIVMSVFARSFKEAQVYLSPLSFVVIIPAFLTQFVTPAEAPVTFFALPVVNSLMLMKGALLGGLTGSQIAVATATSLAFIAVGLCITIRLFSREDVLFRT